MLNGELDGIHTPEILLVEPVNQSRFEEGLVGLKSPQPRKVLAPERRPRRGPSRLARSRITARTSGTMTVKMMSVGWALACVHDHFRRFRGPNLDESVQFCGAVRELTRGPPEPRAGLVSPMESETTKTAGSFFNVILPSGTVESP